MQLKTKSQRTRYASNWSTSNVLPNCHVCNNPETKVGSKTFDKKNKLQEKAGWRWNQTIKKSPTQLWVYCKGSFFMASKKLCASVSPGWDPPLPMNLYRTWNHILSSYLCSNLVAYFPKYWLSMGFWSNFLFLRKSHTDFHPTFSC